LGSQRFSNKEELMEGVKILLSSEAADFFDIGVHKEKLHNEEVHNLYSSPSIIRMMKSRRMR
jgi:hypothetical protein